MATTPFEEPEEPTRGEVIRAQLFHAVDPTVESKPRTAVVLVFLGMMAALAPMPWDLLGVGATVWLALTTPPQKSV